VASAKKRVMTNNMNEMGSRKRGNSLKNRQGILETISTTIVPTPRNDTCLMRGAKKFPDLYAKLLPAENTSTMEMMQRKKYTTQMVGSPLNIFEEIAILGKEKGEGESGGVRVEGLRILKLSCQLVPVNLFTKA
jgi:hypothetical protein